MDRGKLSLGTALGAAALAALLMVGGSLGERAALRPLEALPASAVMTGQGHPTREGQIDINSAGVEELMELPGIGEVKAAAIVADREENGPFGRPEDLIRVKGIGEKTLAGFLDLITVGGDENAEDLSGG